jgi:hypothetical protein
MFIDDYFNDQQDSISFTRDHASNFAKKIADDFNPIHDQDAKRFCVPGDLLFSIILAKYGLNQHMKFIFQGMVMDGTNLLLPNASPQLVIKDTRERDYLTIERSGKSTLDETLIQNLTRSYVAFSGHTFLDVLVPLMAEKKMMINPARPMVIYESMTIDLDRLDIKTPTLEMDHTDLELVGKRGNAFMAFNIMESGQIVGRGEKRMVLSGLREYEQGAMDGLVETYKQRKRDYLG